MDFELSEEHRMLKQAIRDFARSEIAPLCDIAEEKEEFPQGLMREMGKLGYLGVGYPPEYGGTGMGKIGQCLIQEEVGRICAGIASGLNAQMTLTVSTICDHGSDEQKRKYLIPALKGEKIACFGITEPNAGSDISGIQTTAVRSGDGYILNGNKIFTTNGPIADFMLVLAYTDKSKGTRGGLSVFIVEKGTPGFTVSRKLKKVGMHSEETGEEAFENCLIPAGNLVGEEGKGFRYVLKSLSGARIPVAARGIGIASGAYEIALEYARQRVQFGQPISKFQAISFRLSRMETEINAARWLVYHAAWLYDQGKDVSRESAMAKLYSGEVAVKVTQEAMHIQAGYGLMMESPLQRYFRDAVFQRVLSGTDEVQEMAIAWSLNL